MIALHSFSIQDKNVVFLFSKIIFKDNKSLADISGHKLFYINFMHLFTSDLKLYNVWLATKTDISFFAEK